MSGWPTNPDRPAPLRWGNPTASASMGQMRFYSTSALLDEWEASCAYLAGMDGSPWLGLNSLADGVLTIDRAVHESGVLHVPVNTESCGRITLTTASLRERPEPYLLSLELARGTVNRVRSQAADWRLAGLKVPDSLAEQIRQATSRFIAAATVSQKSPEAAEVDALEAINTALLAGERLAEEYSAQSLAIRQKHAAKLPTLLACSLEGLPNNGDIRGQLLTAFNSVALPFRWKDIEPNAGKYEWDAVDRMLQWCQANRLRVCAGPLIRLDRHSLPDWLYLWEEDFDELAGLVMQFIQSVLQRYRGRVHLWQAASRLNVDSELALSEEQRLRLAVGCVDALRQADPTTPIVFSFDQPWGEYLARKDMELPPMQFADTLIRADLGAAGLGLEINLGYWPHGTLPRGLLSISQLIDRWSMFGLPLLIQLSCPSDTEPDPRADAMRQTVSERNLQADVARLIEMLLAKPSVHGIIWNQLSDAVMHEFPHAGLFDGNFQPKPLLGELAEIRRQRLM